MGNWWLYESEDHTQSHVENSSSQCTTSRIKKIPGSKEDVFADKALNLKSKRALMNFLRLAIDIEAQAPVLQEWGERPFEDFLSLYCGIAPQLQSVLHALTLSPTPSGKTPTSYALARIHRHLTSIGVFGPGFGSVIPKWGGIAEIAQVACRAGAVGGGVYVLNKGVEEIKFPQSIDLDGHADNLNDEAYTSTLRLQGGQNIKTEWLAGRQDDLPSSIVSTTNASNTFITRMISIVSSPLMKLFPTITDGTPSPSGTVVVFPTGTINNVPVNPTAEVPPVHLIIHSSDTGECPTGQCKWITSLPYHKTTFPDDPTYEYLSTLSATSLKITYL